MLLGVAMQGIVTPGIESSVEGLYSGDSQLELVK